MNKCDAALCDRHTFIPERNGETYEKREVKQAVPLLLVLSNSALTITYVHVAALMWGPLNLGKAREDRPRPPISVRTLPHYYFTLLKCVNTRNTI